MNTDPLTLSTLAAALGTGLVAGVFFAFSTFVMRGLASLPAGAAVWSRYVPEWTRWNHVRTVASMAATTLFVIAFCGGAS